MRCWRAGCGHDLHVHDPELPHDCHDVIGDKYGSGVPGMCSCRGFIAGPTQPDTDLSDVALQEAARHLAGLGRGKYHRADANLNALGNGMVKLDGVPLRGVQEVSFTSSVGGPTTMTITMIVSLNEDNPPPRHVCNFNSGPGSDQCGECGKHA
jgi:hypothetical protein